MQPSNTNRIVGWVLTVLIGIFLIGGSGIPKFFEFPGKSEIMSKLQIPPDLLRVQIRFYVLIFEKGTPFVHAVSRC